MKAEIKNLKKNFYRITNSTLIYAGFCALWRFLQENSDHQKHSIRPFSWQSGLPERDKAQRRQQSHVGDI